MTPPVPPPASTRTAAPAASAAPTAPAASVRLPALALSAGWIAQAALAAWLALAGPTGTLGLIAWFALRLPACAVAAWGARGLLPATLRAPARPVFAWLAAFEWLLPGLSAGPVLAARIGHRWPVAGDGARIEAVSEPAYTLHGRLDRQTLARAGRLRTKLTDPRVPAEQRVSALLALQDVPAHATADLLRTLLADPLDDIRLLAYGMLDAKEKAISQRLLAEELRLTTAESDDARFGAHKRLAELQWELVYQRLVQGDMRRHAARAARRHAEAALGLDGADGGLWLLLARVALVLDDLEGGRQALVMAEQQGIARALVVPWLAEYAFRERRFADVATLFAELDRTPAALQLAASWRYWTGHAGPAPRGAGAT